ncbi:hypothetical protein OT109_09600 [Phycisphaeraceae bacterium D3-23]
MAGIAADKDAGKTVYQTIEQPQAASSLAIAKIYGIAPINAALPAWHAKNRRSVKIAQVYSMRVDPVGYVFILIKRFTNWRMSEP